MLLAAPGARAQEPADPQPDAVIEQWEQDWILSPDGAQAYHERKRVRLNHDRAYGEFADPKIVYDPRFQEIEIHVARVLTPDGRAIEPPEYSRLEVSPRGASGWPAFAELREKVLVLSGIEPGCVVELEYTRTTSASAASPLAADLRLDHRYPIERRAVRVTTPSAVALAHQLADVLPGEVRHQQGEAVGSVTHSWVSDGLPARPDSPRSLPWTQRCARLTFSTETPDAWLARRLAPVESAAAASDALASVAEEWTRDALDAEGRAKAIQSKLAARFHFVEFPEAWQLGPLRAASAVVSQGYGTPREACASLLALFRAAGLTARAAALTDDDAWIDALAQDAFVTSDVVVLTLDEDAQIWHPRHGRIRRSAAHNGLTLRGPSAESWSGATLPRWSDAGESVAEVTGSASLDAEGRIGGELTVRLSGLFVNPNSLETEDAQKSRLAEIVARVLPGCEVSDFSVIQLTSSMFAASARIRSAQPLSKQAGCWEWSLGGDGPGLPESRLPLEYNTLHQPVRLAGAMEERVDLRLSWPAAWKVESAPQPVGLKMRSWGSAVQLVTPSDGGLRIERRVTLSRCDFAAEDVLDARGPLNEMRSAAARTILLTP